MKKCYLCSLIILFSVAASGQITLTQSDFPTVNTKLGKIVSVPNQGIPLSSIVGSGANPQTFDLRNPINFVYGKQEYFDPSLVAGWAAMHPGANVASIEVEIDSADTNYFFVFYKSTPTTFEILGVTTFQDTTFDMIDDTIHITYGSPDTLISTNYNTQGYTTTDSTGFTLNIMMGLISYTNYSTRNVLVNGYGTLYSPTDTFDVIKVKVIEHEVEYTDTNGVQESFSEKYSYRYKFIAKGVGHPVAEVEMNSTFDTVKFIQYIIPPAPAIVLNQSDFPKPGLSVQDREIRIDSTAITFFDTTGIPMFWLGESGSNGVYDFSNLQYLQSQNDSSTMDFVYPDQTPFSSIYPGSNIAGKDESKKDSLGNLLTQAYFFANSSPNALEFVGWSVIMDSAQTFGNSDSVLASGILDTGNLKIVPPLTFMSTNYALGYTSSDSANSSFELFNGNFKITWQMIQNVEVDGYGKLLTYFGAFDVLRTKVVEYEKATIEKYGTIDTIEENTRYYYNFFAKNIGLEILSASMDSTWTNLKSLKFSEAIITPGTDLCNTSCVWPGDASGNLLVNHYDILPIGLYYGDTGSARNYASNHWMGFTSQSWADTMYNGRNLKHADCNGDGVINFNDVTAVKKNFKQTHNKTSNSNSPNPANPDLYFEVLTPNVAPGTEVEVKVMAGKDSVSLYGLAFEIQLDTAVIERGTIDILWDSSWLGKVNVSMIVIKNIQQDEGTVMAGCVRNTGDDKKNMGEIARLKFKIKADASDSSMINLQGSTEGGVGSTGNSVLFNNENDTIIVTSTKKIAPIVNTINIYPNPSTGELNFDITNNQQAEINIYNSLGQKIYYLNKFTANKFKIDLGSFPNGVYSVQVRTNSQLLNQKVLLLKNTL